MSRFWRSFLALVLAFPLFATGHTVQAAYWPEWIASDRMVTEGDKRLYIAARADAGYDGYSDSIDVAGNVLVTWSSSWPKPSKMKVKLVITVESLVSITGAQVGNSGASLSLGSRTRTITKEFNCTNFTGRRCRIDLSGLSMTSRPYFTRMKVAGTVEMTYPGGLRTFSTPTKGVSLVPTH